MIPPYVIAEVQRLPRMKQQFVDCHRPAILRVERFSHFVNELFALHLNTEISWIACPSPSVTP